uniref:Uncharacterized protein n=1 Tax=Eutreptiella gymnastica TaxID=73025 RepID=A0A7S4CTZ3_9EUGL
MGLIVKWEFALRVDCKTVFTGLESCHAMSCDRSCHVMSCHVMSSVKQAAAPSTAAKWGNALLSLNCVRLYSPKQAWLELQTEFKETNSANLRQAGRNGGCTDPN